ncbi:MAG: DUF2796 domain-containing protein [Gammaproteobacteria bacterium]
MFKSKVFRHPRHGHLKSQISALIPLCVAGLAMTSSAPTLAADAHVHGLAHMNVALDGHELVIEMESPLANFVGFEHEPSTPEQHELLEHALADLKKPASLINLPKAAECHPEKVTVELAHMEEHEAHEGEGHEQHDEHEAEHGHEKHAKHEEHRDQHEHEHEEAHADHKDEHKGHEEHAQHADADLRYHFQCEHGEELKALNLAPLFKRFPQMEKLQVQVIGPNGQSAAELTQGASELSF